MSCQFINQFVSFFRLRFVFVNFSPLFSVWQTRMLKTMSEVCMIFVLSTGTKKSSFIHSFILSSFNLFLFLDGPLTFNQMLEVEKLIPANTKLILFNLFALDAFVIAEANSIPCVRIQIQNFYITKKDIKSSNEDIFDQFTSSCRLLFHHFC